MNCQVGVFASSKFKSYSQQIKISEYLLISFPDHGDQFAEDTKKRREIISAILLKGEQNSCSESPKKAAGVQSTKFFDLDELIMKPDETFFLKDIVGLEEAKITLLQAIVLPVVDPDLVERDYRWTGILLFGI